MRGNAELWIFLFIIGLLGLNWPLLEIFHTEEAGYLFSFWLLFIVFIAVVAYKQNNHQRQGSPEGKGAQSPAPRTSRPEIK
ncbi:MAG: hypothetical protein AB1553_09200 [Nitrospirota bacterium]